MGRCVEDIASDDAFYTEPKFAGMTLIVGNNVGMGAHRARFFKAFRWQAQKVRDAYAA